MTAGCGLARNYMHLFIARIGVGVGEATLTPSALSLISDYFPKEKRGRAISFYNMGISIGVGIAMILGGLVINYVQNAPDITLPFIGMLYPWQTVFIIVGLPGLIIAVLMATVIEPDRKELLITNQEQGTELKISFVIQYMFSRWKTFISLFLGMSIVTIIGYAYFSWIPTMFIRVHDWSIKEIGLAYGTVLLIFGPIGVNFGGWLADNLYRRGYKDGHMRATLIGAIISVPTATAVPLMPTPELAVAMLIPASIGPAMTTATGSASLMMITPNQMRGQFSAIYLFVINMLGLTLGPTAVALVTDFVFHDESALHYSIALVSFVAGCIALIFLYINLAYYRLSVEESESWSE
jgi:MFS family permease